MSDHPSEPPIVAAGHHFAPDEVWDRAREDYLAGLSAEQTCRRHGLKVGTLRARAAREKWRRSDQPWAPATRLDPDDEGVTLEASVCGDLDALEPRQLMAVAANRMTRAVLRGEAAQALLWRRVRDAMRAEQIDFEHFMAAEQEWEFQHGLGRADAAPAVDGFDGRDGPDPLFGVQTVETGPASAPAAMPPPLGNGVQMC